MRSLGTIPTRLPLVGSSLLAAICAACGGGEPSFEPDDLTDVAAFRHVLLRSDGPEPAAPRSLALLRANEDAPPWTPNADRSGFGVIESKEPGGADIPVSVIERDGEMMWVRGPIPEAGLEFTTVILEAASLGRRSEEIRLILYRDGKPFGAPKLRDMARHDDLQIFSFEYPSLRGEGSGADEFAVAFAGKNRRAQLASVSFVEMPTESFSPKMTGEGDMVRVGDTLERSIGMLASRTVTGEFDVSGDDQFRMAFAIHPGLDRKGDKLTFDVEIEGVAGKIERSISVSDGDKWKELKLNGTKIGIGPAKLTARMTSKKDEHGVGLLTIPTLRRLSPREGDREPKTVILITSDTHRADHLGILGPDAPVSTPNLDSLARRGVLFTNCASLTNVTIPSHIALMTGLHPRDVGVLTNVDRLVDSASTLAEAFRAAGYETFAATSAPNLVDLSGLGQGFDKMDGPDRGQRPGTVAVERIAGWLDEAGEADVFAWLHVYDAHAPYSPPEPYANRYYKRDPNEGDGILVDDLVIPAWAKDVKDIEYLYAQYRAEVDFVDGSLVKILEHARAADAIIAFTSDHGELFGEQGVWWSHAGLFPGTLRVPLIMDWPGAPKGARSDVPVKLTDVGTTILNLAGVEGDVVGRDLIEMMEDPPAAEPRFAISAHHHEASIESGGWFLRLDMNRHKGIGMSIQRHVGETQLFNIESDPDCEHDLLLEEFDRAVKMREVLMEWVQTAPTERLSEGRERTDAETEMLAELGYGGGGQAESAEAYWNPIQQIGKARWQKSVWRKLFEDDDYGVEEFKAETGRQ